VLVVHFAFILWMALGGFAVVWRFALAWLHLPAVAWGVWIEVTHGICPLTPLENSLRVSAGLAGYRDSFVDHYIAPIIYPKGLTGEHQLVIAAVLVGANVLLYGWALSRRRRRERA